MIVLKVEQVTCDREGPGNQGAGAPRPQPRRAVWAQRKGPREGDPRAHSSQLWRPRSPTHPFLLSCLNLFQLQASQKLGYLKSSTSNTSLDGTACCKWSFQHRAECAEKKGETWVLKTKRLCLCLTAPGALAWGGGRVMLLAPQWAEIWASPQHRPAWLLTKTVTCRFLQPWVLMACFHCYLSTYLLSAQRNNQ